MNQANNLVLVHGLLGSLSFFDPQRYLVGINVLSPDLHGYADSPIKPMLTLQNQVDYLKSFIDTKISEPTWLLGHSVGGAIVNLFANQYPEQVAGIINVEGNFTIKDAFWCQSISKKEPQAWKAEYEHMCSDAEKWLTESQIEPSPQRVSWAKEILAYQNADSVQAVAKAVVEATDTNEYLAIVNKVVSSDIPVYLLAGEQSLAGWDIPNSVRQGAQEQIVVDNTGHMMMLEKPEEFCRVVNRVISG